MTFTTPSYTTEIFITTPDGIVAHENMDHYIISKSELQDGETGWVTFFDEMQGILRNTKQLNMTATTYV